MTHRDIHFGIDTFGDATVGADGLPLPLHQVTRDIIEEGVLADAVGIDHFSIGEHHRDDFAVSAPDVVLAAIAARTTRVSLGSAVVVLSSDDPVRVYERYATLDALSHGRAEITVGRGSFTESFPLFGYNLADYEILFEEKLGLLAALRNEQPVTWSGSTRGPLRDQSVYPATEGGRLPIWVGVGGSPESVVRAARYGMNMMLAVIGGPAARFAPFVDLFRSENQRLGHPALPVGIHSGGFVLDSDAKARDVLFPFYKTARDRIGRERGWPPLTAEHFAKDIQNGSLYAGSPDTVAAKIASTVTRLGVNRFDLKYSNGALPHSLLMRSIELYGSEVVPRVRRLLELEDARLPQLSPEPAHR